MKSGLIEQEVRRLAAEPGVWACALVEGGSGLVLSVAGTAIDGRLWEAAVEYWRLHMRMTANFVRLGELYAAVMHHHVGKLVLLPCGADSDLLVVCVADHRGVDWTHWQLAVRRMAARLRT
jgi:hypothetical protein